jgi:hypothetical protein
MHFGSVMNGGLDCWRHQGGRRTQGHGQSMIRPMFTSQPTALMTRLPALVILAAALLPPSVLPAATPIRLHPDNPRWFIWRGKPVARITSGEVYSSVVNPDFNFQRYLDTLHREGMNYTRIFPGTYIEVPGDFGVDRNSLVPAPGRSLAPWARSNQPGYAGGGNQFDLDRFFPRIPCPAQGIHRRSRSTRHHR